LDEVKPPRPSAGSRQFRSAAHSENVVSRPKKDADEVSCERQIPAHALNRYRDILGEFGIPTEAASEDPADKMKAPF
jgi:hypothetical protein